MTPATIVKDWKLWLGTALALALMVGYFVFLFMYVRATGMP